MFTDPEVDCVFCDKSVYDHSNFESRDCLAKHLQVQKILQSALEENTHLKFP